MKGTLTNLHMNHSIQTTKSLKKPSLLIIFDMDNTILEYKDDLSFFDDMLKETIMQMGIKMPLKVERYAFWGSGGNYPNILKKWGISENQISKFWNIFDNIDYRARIKIAEQGRIYVTPGLLEILQKLRSEGHKLAILSNSNQPLVDFFIEKFELDRYFDHAVGLSKSKKPEECKPELGNLIPIIDAYGFQDHKEFIFMIGDSDSDIETANRAGIHAIKYVPDCLYLEADVGEKGPDVHYLREFGQLPDLIIKILESLALMRKED